MYNTYRLHSLYLLTLCLDLAKLREDLRPQDKADCLFLFEDSFYHFLQGAPPSLTVVYKVEIVYNCIINHIIYSQKQENAEEYLNLFELFPALFTLSNCRKMRLPLYGQLPRLDHIF